MARGAHVELFLGHFNLGYIHNLKPGSMPGPRVDCVNSPRANECICQAHPWLGSILSLLLQFSFAVFDAATCGLPQTIISVQEFKVYVRVLAGNI